MGSWDRDEGERMIGQRRRERLSVNFLAENNDLNADVKVEAGRDGRQLVRRHRGFQIQAPQCMAAREEDGLFFTNENRLNSLHPSSASRMTRSKHCMV